MSFPETIEIWADTLTRKHECGTERAIRATMSVESEPVPIEVWMPDLVSGARGLEFRAYSRFGDLLLLIAHLEEDEEDSQEPRCFLMLARKHVAGTFRCHVWQELYHFTLDLLGLETATIPARILSVVHEPERPDDD